MSRQNADVKRIRDPNNFITIILNKINLARDFHQRVALSITSKRILGCLIFKFYLRKRHNELYLYIRLLDNFGSKSERSKFVKDIIILVPELEIQSTKGNYTGWIIHLTDSKHQGLINFLRLCALLSKPELFYKQPKQLVISYSNDVKSSTIPIHITILKSKFDKLQCTDLINLLNGVSINDRPNNGTYDIPKPK